MKYKSRLLRKIAGIDVSMDTFTACYASLELSGSHEGCPIRTMGSREAKLNFGQHE